jgi:hypothetical protein
MRALVLSPRAAMRRKEVRARSCLPVVLNIRAEVRRKAAILLTSARTAGECMDHSRWGFSMFIG